MDIRKIKPIERTIEIKKPDGTPMGIRVRVMSVEDERLKKLKRTFTDERFKLESKGKSLKTEDVERNGNILLFTASLGWEWYNPTGKEGDHGYDADAMPMFGDTVPEYNQRNFIEMLDELSWFGDQLREEIDDTKSFFDNSKGS